MSTFKRLLPAPPPSKNAWGVNQSIDGNDPSTITQHNDNRTNLSSRNSKEQKWKNNSYYRNIQFTNLTDKPPNLTEDIEMISNNMKFISFSQSPFCHQLEIQVQLLYRSQHQSQIITISSPIWLTLMIITNTPIWENMKM